MPKLSIIVPTADRADTLHHALRTLIDQQYADCEFVVSDNAGKSDTRDVVLSLSDKRICYVRADRRLSMCDSWEFALQHSSGEFITYMGDDDGLLPGAAASAMSLIDDAQVGALVWKQAHYHWPDHIDENLRNWFAVPVGRLPISYASGARKLRNVMRFRETSSNLPTLYNSIVRRSFVDDLRQESTNGNFFNAIAPDTFSGIALSTAVGTYLLSEQPFSVAGISRHSTGASYWHRGTQGENNPAARFASENITVCDSRVKPCPSPAAIVMTEYLLVREFLPKLKLPEPDWRRYVHTLVKSARYMKLGDEILRSAAHTTQQLRLGINIPAHVETPPLSKSQIGMEENLLRFKAPSSMVKNVYDACNLISGMLPMSPETPASYGIGRSIRNLKASVLTEAKALYRSL